MSFSFKSHANTGEDFVAGHNDTKDGNPAGGYAVGPKSPGFPMNGLISEKAGAEQPTFAIRWQDGPVNREAGEKPNGTFVEDVLDVCARRLEFYQDSPFACEENGEAHQAILHAINVLNRRRADRRDRGVEGKNEA